MKKPMVKLNDGTKVPLEEFVTWSTRKQNNKTMPIEEFEEKKAKRVEALKRAVSTPFGQFSTFKEAVEKTKISSATLLSRLKNTAIPEYYYVNPKPSDLAKEFYSPLKTDNSKKTITPLGLFDSIAIAAEAHGLSRNGFYKLLKTESANYYLKENGPKPNLNTVRKKSISKNREKSIIRNQFDEQAKSGRSVKTPMGVFRSMKEAVQKTGITISPLRRLLYSEEFPEYSILNTHPTDKKRIIKKITQEEKNARQANKAFSRRRPVITPIGEFPSIVAASNAHKLLRSQLGRLLQNPAFPEFRYLESKPKIPNKNKSAKPNNTTRIRRPDQVMTPEGRFLTKLRAALALNISSRDLEMLFITNPKKYYLVSYKRKSQAKS